MTRISTPIAQLQYLLGEDRVVSDPSELIVYECDGLVLNKNLPDAVVYPDTTEEVSAIVRICAEHKVPFLARGAGTGLSGGAVADAGGVIIQMSRMNRILEIDYEDEIAVVQPGVVNLELSEYTATKQYHFAPDPASQKASTVGGNIAENAGGPHTLKYGVTANHVLGLKVVLPCGEVVDLGGRTEDSIGYDLTGLLIGSEGTFGIVTEAIVKLTRNPEAAETFLGVFSTVEDASNTVSSIIAGGIIPAALELIDDLAVRAVESHLKVGFPTDAGAVLLIEIDGVAATLNEESIRIKEICLKNKATQFHRAQSEDERALLWRGRKEAVGALGKISPAFYTNDGVVPRSKLPQILEHDVAVGRKYGLAVAHLCHAGDGNIHPLILYDPESEKEVKAALEASEEILEKCVELGGSLTGEHGIGAEKRKCFALMFSEDDQAQMMHVRNVFNPDGLLNPGKIFPMGSNCGEARVHKTTQKLGWL